MFGINSLIELMLGLSCGDNGNYTPVTTAFMEVYNTVNQCIQCIILANTDILTGIVTSTALTHDNITGQASLTTPNLYA